MKEVVVVSNNGVGSLAAVAEALGSVGVNIEAISAYGVGGKAVFRFITNDATTSMKALSKIHDLELREAETVVYRMINRPGELGKITRKLANRGISLESIFIVGSKPDFTEVAFRPSEKDLAKTKDVLGVK